MSDKLYFLGIDGGGSKTAFTLIDENKNIIYEVIKGPSSIDTVSMDTFKKCIIDGTKDIKVKVDSIFIGVGGISNNKQIEEVKAILKELPICKKNTIVDANNDIYSALYGSLSGKDGIVIIAGTGSCAFGKYNNKYHRVGGYSYKEGDPGSAYYLGTKALQYLAKVVDKRYPESNFSKDLMDAINCYNFESLTYFFNHANRSDIASLSKVVTKNEDNEIARSIIDDATDEMILMIKTVYNYLSFKGTTYFSIIGSLGNADTLYKELLLKKLHDISDEIVFVKQENEASMGSALKALENKKLLNAL